jgi:hypothetical protein
MVIAVTTSLVGSDDRFHALVALGGSKLSAESLRFSRRLCLAPLGQLSAESFALRARLSIFRRASWAKRGSEVFLVSPPGRRIQYLAESYARAIFQALSSVGMLLMMTHHVTEDGAFSRSSLQSYKTGAQTAESTPSLHLS